MFSDLCGSQSKPVNHGVFKSVWLLSLSVCFLSSSHCFFCNYKQTHKCVFLTLSLCMSFLPPLSLTMCPGDHAWSRVQFPHASCAACSFILWMWRALIQSVTSMRQLLFPDFACILFSVSVVAFHSPFFPEQPEFIPGSALCLLGAGLSGFH